MKIVTAEQMRRIDRVTIDQRGVSGAELMDRAGRAVAREAIERFEPDSVAVVTGKGNNAGDGFVVARELAAQGIFTTLFMLCPPEELSGDALGAFEKLSPDARKIVQPGAATLRDRLREYDLIVDAILGTGLSGPAREPLAAAIEAVNAAQTNVLAIDVPSGLPSETPAPGDAWGPCVRAMVTVAIGLPKAGMIVGPGARHCGAIVVEDIGFPEDLLTDPAIQANLMSLEEAAALLPPRPAWGHKGAFGKVLILAGSEGMTGAAILAASAASRSGVGLVYCAYPRPLGTIMESRLLEPVKAPLAGETPWFSGQAHAAQALRLAEGMDAVAIGPGLGRRPETRAFLSAIVRGVRAPLLIDADGLRLLAENLDDLARRPGPTVLTPHPGEAAALLGASGQAEASVEVIEAGRLNVMAPLASRHGAVVALKGAKTVVTAPGGQRWVNPSGNTGLAKGGSGDVLTGLIAGLLAQGAAPLDATRLGVFLHGMAADLAAETASVRALLPSDVIDALGQAFLKLERLERA